MNYKKLFGFGALIWGVIYLVTSGFVGYGMMDTLWAKITILIVIAVIVFLAGKNTNPNSLAIATKYSAGWVVIALILDEVFTTPFTGWEIFSRWNVLIGYAIILLLPLLLVKKDKSSDQAPNEATIPEQTPESITTQEAPSQEQPAQ